MPVCFVPNCSTGYLKTLKQNKQNNVRNPSLFSPPVDPVLLKLWSKKIPRCDKPLGEKDKVCSQHFRDSDIIKYDELVLKDGTKYRSERKNWKLKKDAIPRLFLNCAEYFSDVIPARKSLKKRALVQHVIYKKRRRLQMSDSVQIEIPFIETPIEIDQQTITFNDLLEVDLPPLWSSSVLPSKGLVYLRWTEDGQNIQKRIHITPNLEIKTFLYDKEIELVECRQVKSISTVPNVMKIMDDILCENVIRLNFEYDALEEIVYKLYQEKLPLIGCAAHEVKLTRDIVNFLLIARIYFIIKIIDKNCKEAIKKKKRKQSKLQL